MTPEDLAVLTNMVKVWLIIAVCIKILFWGI